MMEIKPRDIWVFSMGKKRCEETEKGLGDKSKCIMLGKVS